MAESREIKVRLVAEVDGYVEGMERAAAVTSGLVELLRKLGITEEDMPAAIKGVVSIIRDTKAS